MILGDVEETVTTVVIDEETYEEIYKVFHIKLLDIGEKGPSWPGISVVTNKLG
jgi:hypothetical protein